MISLSLLAMRRWSAWLINVFIFTGSTLFACLLAEGLARALCPSWAPRTAHLAQFWQYDATYGWVHIPNAKGRFKADGYDTEVTINDKGFRGPSIPYKRTPGYRRILLLGDSFVWGFGVDFDQTVGERLRALQPNLEVVNLGVSGYSTDQELLLYQQEGVKYRADLVVVVVSSNDFHGNQRTEEYLIYGKPAFIPRGNGLHLVNQPVRQVSWVRRLAVKMAWESYILTRLQRYLYEISVDKAMRQTYSQPASFSNGISAATASQLSFPRTASWDILIRLLKAFNDVTSREGAKFLVAFVEDIDARDASRYLKQLGVESVMLQDSINPTDPATHLPGDFHWNAAGHQQAAEVLSAKVRELLGLPPEAARNPSLSLVVHPGTILVGFA